MSTNSGVPGFTFSRGSDGILRSTAADYEYLAAPLSIDAHSPSTAYAPAEHFQLRDTSLLNGAGMFDLHAIANRAYSMATQKQAPLEGYIDSLISEVGGLCKDTPTEDYSLAISDVLEVLEREKAAYESALKDGGVGDAYARIRMLAARVRTKRMTPESFSQTLTSMVTKGVLSKVVMSKGVESLSPSWHVDIEYEEAGTKARVRYDFVDI